MPIYEYVCTKCGHPFSQFQRSRKPTFPCCPRCGGITEKRFSVPYIIVR
jgi:putative FmdB family regulatory protein